MVVEVSLALASGLISYAANKLLGDKNKSPIQDDKPTSLASKGAYLPWLIGRRRVGSLIAYAGLHDRHAQKEKIDGGKGGAFGSPKQTVWYEIGWHHLCIGPIHRLYRIWQNGSVIFSGPIDRTSNPSGSSIDVGKEGIFEIWWGESDQPNNTIIADPTRFGIDSQWPLIGSVLWNKKRLGTTAVWQLIEYDVEVRPIAGGLTRSNPWIEPEFTLDAPNAKDITIVTNGLPGVAKVNALGKFKALFPPGGKLLIQNNAATANGEYDIWACEYSGTTNTTTITLGNKLTGAIASTGEIVPYVESLDAGVNAAHAIYQLLFAKYPHGLGYRTTKVDLLSLEDLGQLIQEERIPCSVLAQNGEEALGVFSNLLQDLGVMVPIVNGKMVFKPIREPTGVLTLPDGIVMSPKPEREIQHGSRTTSKLIFTFADVERNFKDGTVFIDDDGRARRVGHPTPRKIEIPSVIDFKTAAIISERRSQEEAGSANKHKLTANRGSRKLYPGQAFVTSELPNVVRVSSKRLNTSSGKVELDVVDDFYGLAASTFQNTQGGGLPGSPEEPQQDLQFDIVEVPGYTIGDGQQAIIVPRIRATEGHFQADIWLSVDDVTYTNVGQETDFQAGGTLIDALTGLTTDLDYLVTGPTFTVLGPDIVQVLDLSADDANFFAGRQLCVITNGTVTEVCYLRKVTAISGTTYRLDGLLRQRQASGKRAWSAGSRIYIFRNDGVLTVQDILLAPNTTVYVKTQPSTSSTISLADAFSKSRLLRGLGRIPENPDNIKRQDDKSLTYTTQAAPGAVPFEWNYRSLATARTGAGMQGAGAASASSAIKGVFIFRVRTAAGALKREVDVGTALTYTYLQADYTTDFGGGGVASYKVSVQNVDGGYASEEVTVTMTVL